MSVKKFETIIEIRDEWIDRLEALLKAVQDKDETFEFEWRKDSESGAKAVVLFSKNKPQAHRRGLFLKECISDPEMFGTKISYSIRRAEK